MNVMRLLTRLIFPALFLAVISLAWGGNVRAEEEWQGRFETLCARTGEVMNLTPAELQVMIEECESFRPRIEALPESPRKIYRKRLTLSCNLVRFALEQKRAPLQQE